MKYCTDYPSGKTDIWKNYWNREKKANIVLLSLQNSYVERDDEFSEVNFILK